MKKHIIIVFTMSLLSVTSFAQNTNDFFSKADAFFKAYVVNGKVNYSKIHNEPQNLDEVLKIAEGISVSKTDASVYQAFWINAYNLSVVKGIIDNYPLNSPLDKKGFFDKTTYALGGKNTTLNNIEHKLLREVFNDARFHFVLVCGAIGCPPLISKAYLPKTVDSQMTKQTKIALNGSFLKVNVKKKRVEASQIMEWYKGDFTMDGKNEIDFINLYRTDKISTDFKLSYFPYNWKTNAL